MFEQAFKNDDLAEFVKLRRASADSPKPWSEDAEELRKIGALL